ncbi:SDR family oxidoreductase [Streptomyces sp. NPDC051913]|uniref:SDR family oxidoreductase n=1 Tax=Streptomyces sp. NPDC051913 TaxID=3365676 RepID=UPI0037CDD9E0
MRTRTLNGRRVLVTGASAGIGLAIAEALSAAGAVPLLLARPGARLADAVARTGGLPVPADLRSASATAEAISRIGARTGAFDALVNNAGIVRLDTVADGEREQWQELLDVNVLGLLDVTRAALPFLTRGEAGQIINISSLAGQRVRHPAQSVYAASKAAVDRISAGLRLELAAAGVRVTTVSPGFTLTNEGAGITRPELRKRMADGQRQKGLLAADVADQVVQVLVAPAHVHILEISLQSINQEYT